MADTQDGDGSDRPRMPPPEASALDHETTAASTVADVACSRTRTFETCDDELARALREQFTRQLNTELRRYAEYRARMVRAAGRVCPPPVRYARELVHDAYADTWSGERAWDPKRCSLAEHLRGVIDSRTWNELKAPRQYTPLDARPIVNVNEDRLGDERLALVDTLSASCEDISSVALPALFARTCHELRQATNEHDCIAIVRAWELGFIAREEIMELTGLGETAYRRARGRLLYLAGDLPDELRRLVRDYLRSA